MMFILSVIDVMPVVNHWCWQHRRVRMALHQQWGLSSSTESSMIGIS